MRAQWMKLFLAAGAVWVSGVAVQAQTYEMVANVPFAFQVGNNDFAAGKYTLERQGLGPDSLRSPSGRGTFIAGNPNYESKAKVQPRLVFRCYGDMRFLAEIWGTTSRGTKIAPGAREREMAAAGKTYALLTIPLSGPLSGALSDNGTN